VASWDFIHLHHSKCATPHQSTFLLTGPNHLLRVSSAPLIPPPLLGACMELLAIHGQKPTLSEGHRQWVPWVRGWTITRWQTSWDPTYRKRNTTSLAPLLRYVLCIGTHVCCFVKLEWKRKGRGRLRKVVETCKKVLWFSILFTRTSHTLCLCVCDVFVNKIENHKTFLQVSSTFLSLPLPFFSSTFSFSFLLYKATHTYTNT